MDTGVIHSHAAVPSAIRHLVPDRLARGIFDNDDGAAENVSQCEKTLERGQLLIQFDPPLAILRSCGRIEQALVTPPIIR